MDNSLSHGGSSSPRSGGLLTSLGVVGRILGWLTTLFLLSDEQQQQAGVDLSRGHRW
jgi:hypothetical protein